MSHHAQAAPRWRSFVLVGGSLAALAIAGGTTAQAFASGGHHGDRGASHNVASHGHASRGDAHARRADASDPTLALGQAVSAVASGTVSQVSSYSDVIGDPADPAIGRKVIDPGLGETGLQLAPAGGSGEGTVMAFAAEAGTGGSDEPVCGSDPENTYTWQECSSTTLPDGSRVQTAVSSDGEAAVAERTLNGVVERVYAFAPAPGADPVLTADQLTRVVARLAVPSH